MKLIFAGTPEIAIPALTVLLDSPHEICAVYTRPDSPAGRGQKLTASPIKLEALKHNLLIYQPETLKDPDVQRQMQDLNADILVNVAYGMILPKAVLDMFKFGCINIHPSLLPRWRGAAPIQRAIFAGDKITAVTIMQMDEGLDTGGIYKQENLPIENSDTSATLSVKAAKLGAKLLLETINDIEAGKHEIKAQDNANSTYAKKLSKEEGVIDWNKSAQEIDCMIRAFNPWPVAHTQIDDQTIRIWQAQITNSTTKELPGTIIQADKNGIDVATGDGVLRLLKIQLPGKKPLLAKEILNASNHAFVLGKKIGS